MNFTGTQRSKAIRLIIGWCALVLYAGDFTSLGLGVAAVAGSLDRSHHVAVHGSGQALELVLQHGRNCAGHHHGVVARALTLLARPASATDPDHVIQFNPPDSYSRPAQLLAPALASLAPPDLALLESSFPLPRENLLSSRPTHSPPAGGGPLLYLRSTLLLI